VTSARGGILDGRYQIRSTAGRGGMATVYRAIDLRHDRSVAVKVLRPGLPEAAVTGFLNEIRLTARFHHPHILPVLDSGTVDGVPYFVMPFVRCRSFRYRLDRTGPLAWRDARPLLAEVADALAYAHRQGVIHLDIKPENILLSEGHAYVTDFGIARALCSATAGSEDLVVGTPEYMSPEQAMGDTRLDARSDVYSFAAVIHEVLTGAPPYRGSTAGEILHHHLRGAALPAIREGMLGAGMRAVLTRALARCPDRRPPTPKDLVRALDHTVGVPDLPVGVHRLGGRRPTWWEAPLLGRPLHG